MQHAKSALSLLITLLTTGPESVLSYSLDLIPTIQGLIHINKKDSVDIRPNARSTLSLLLDHRKLAMQRKWFLDNKHTQKTDHLKTKVGSTSKPRQKFPFGNFEDLHRQLQVRTNVYNDRPFFPHHSFITLFFIVDNVCGLQKRFLYANNFLVRCIC